MNDPLPLVTILIATKDRGNDLRLTLREMRAQRYPSLELVVIDDGSAELVGPIVHEEWPGATVLRYETNAGQCARRNEGFGLAKGDFILQLDDDCSLAGPDDIAYAIDTMHRHPEAGAIACYIVNSPDPHLPVETSTLNSGCISAFVGAAVFFRKSAIRQTSGYRAFFSNEWEEEELSLQLLGAGWQIFFVPRIVALHRLSLSNRNSARTWMRGLRNRLWALVIHMPVRRLPVEIGWKLTIGAWDAIRLIRFQLFLQALVEASSGFPRAWRLRQPLSALGRKRYDALRLYPVITAAAFGQPPAVTWRTVADYCQRWRNRARNRSAWDPEEGDIGTSYIVAYSHEERLKASPLPADKNQNQ